MFNFIYNYLNKKFYTKEEINMELSKIVEALVEIKKNQAEAYTEISAKLDALAAFLDSDPVAAMALLDEIRVQAKSLADIVNT
jgi:hypothetical protein